MNWGSREECHCSSTVWEEKFWSRSIRKSTRYVVKFRAQKLAIVFQHKLLFNLVKDFFKWFESLGRSNTARVYYERKIIVDLGGIRKKYWIGCQISRSKSRYKAFQHKLLFNIVEDLFKWIEVLERSVNVRVQSERERNFDLGCIRKVPETLSNFALKNSIYSVSTYIAFQPSQGLIQMNWGSREECHCPSTVWEGRNFWPNWYMKKSTRYVVKFRAQKLAI